MTNIRNTTKAQKAICKKYNAGFSIPSPEMMMGVSDSLKSGARPIHGLRHPETKSTTGWYIWAGEYSDDPDFFKPIHAEHVLQEYPELAPYLGLAPGWRFLIDPEKHHEDIWQDNSLLDI